MTKIEIWATSLTKLVVFSILAIGPTLAQQVKTATNKEQKVETASLIAATPHSLNAAVRTLNPNSTVWLAPIGHRQPRLADISVSTSKDSYDFAREDANVDRKINGICRGC